LTKIALAPWKRNAFTQASSELASSFSQSRKTTSLRQFARLSDHELQQIGRYIRRFFYLFAFNRPTITSMSADVSTEDSEGSKDPASPVQHREAHPRNSQAHPPRKRSALESGSGSVQEANQIARGPARRPGPAGRGRRPRRRRPLPAHRRRENAPGPGAEPVTSPTRQATGSPPEPASRTPGPAPISRIARSTRVDLQPRISFVQETLRPTGPDRCHSSV